MSAGNEEFTAEFFDESSKAWLQNKVRMGASMVYKCKGVCKDGELCKRTASMFHLSKGPYCRLHFSQGIEEIINKSVSELCGSV